MPEKKNEPIEKTTPPSSDDERERLRRDMNRSDIEKLDLFVRMLRQNALFKRAKVIHK